MQSFTFQEFATLELRRVSKPTRNSSTSKRQLQCQFNLERFPWNFYCSFPGFFLLHSELSTSFILRHTSEFQMLFAERAASASDPPGKGQLPYKSEHHNPGSALKNLS